MLKGIFVIYSESFQAEKQSAIARLKTNNKFLEELLSKNDRVRIFNSDQIDKMRDILDKNKKFQHKLESNEFEIAIVGLEKAGKSTFANALIESNVLPSAPERCTFTSTRLVSGDDKAFVEFYTEKEFNDIFRALLIEIEYPESDAQSFRELNISHFENYFSGLDTTNNNLYKNHIGKTDEEIKDILKNRDKLTLTGEIREFSGDELDSDIFQSYIKGENKGQDTSKPRSVKKIVIESSKLRQMESAIIYDVPGFDSPTKIHIRQTEERLKHADAIILVTNVGRNPSIQGTSLSVINKNSDADGIPLRDKLFVFGNQLDMANNFEEAEGNRNILTNDVEKYKIGERKRVFTGSALKYLVDKNLRKEKIDAKYAISAGIEEIRAELQHYYETDRFDILQRKISSNKITLQTLFSDVLKNADMKEDPHFSDNEKGRIIRETYKSIEKNIRDNLNKFKFTQKESILKEQYFSNKFKENVMDGMHFNHISEKDIEDAKISTADSLTSDLPSERINQYIRKNLHSKFLKELSVLVRELTNEKAQEIEAALLHEYTISILGSAHHPLFSEAAVACKQIIGRITKDISHNEDRFAYLIERFSRDTFDILILSPLLSADRTAKFIEAEKEFIYLNNYFRNGKSSLVHFILGGGYSKTEEMQATFIPGIKAALKLAEDIIPMCNNGASITLIANQIKKLAEILKSSEASSQRDYDISEILKGKSRSITEDEILNEINYDINNLKEIIQTAVVPAANLDLAFCNSIDKQVKLLIDAIELDGKNKDKFNLFNEFLTRIVNKIKQSEFDSINERMESYKLQKEILKKIQEVEL